MAETHTPGEGVQVVLCDENGQPTGTADRTQAHSGQGLLHQAFSVFVFRNDGQEVLLQQRSSDKPLFAGRWANTCCSHPRVGESDTVATAMSRLDEEFGFSLPLEVAGSFVYSARDGENGVEREHDTVLTGHMGDAIELSPNPEEIAAWKWVRTHELTGEIDGSPELYAPWLRPALQIALTTLS